MKRFVLLTLCITIFVIAQGISGLPSHFYQSKDLEEDYFDDVVSEHKVKMEINLPNHFNFPKLNLPFPTFSINTSDEKAVPHTIHQNFNKMVKAFRDFAEDIALFIKQSIKKHQVPSVNIASNNKPQENVSTSAPNEHTASVDNQQSTTVKNDDKEKLEHNKNPLISESTVSTNAANENAKPVTKPALAIDLPVTDNTPVLSVNNEKIPDSQGISEFIWKDSPDKIDLDKSLEAVDEMGNMPFSDWNKKFRNSMIENMKKKNFWPN